MPATVRPLAALLFLPGVLAAQASRYIPLDDPRLPAFEHLVRLGDVDDPSPSVRPFRRADAVRAIDSGLARGTLRDSALGGALRQAWQDDTLEARWEAGAHAGIQAYTEARRDPLHPAGPDGFRPYLEVPLAATFGPFSLVSRPAIEPRLERDPDWPGRRDLSITGRHADGYIMGEWRWIRVFYGQTDRNWGPVGLPGIPLSHYGYPRPELAVEIGNDRFRLRSHALTLTDATDSTGAVVHRYFFAHRVDVHLSRRFQLGLWETVVLAGPARSFDGRYRNPVTLLLLANQYGLGAEGNVLVGVDARWRVGRRTTLQAQLALDDFQYQNRSGPTRYPDRYAFTLMATGALTRQVAWRAAYTQASSLAFRTASPFEAFTDQAVGLGRSFADNDQVLLGLSLPIARDWMVEPEVTLLRQGEGRIGDPWPTGTAAGDTPFLHIGVTERTWRGAVAVSGRRGAVSLKGSAGIQQVQNAAHQRGESRTEFAGRLQATIGFDTRGGF